jgi:hypothetical protein
MAKGIIAAGFDVVAAGGKVAGREVESTFFVALFPRDLIALEMLWLACASESPLSSIEVCRISAKLERAPAELAPWDTRDGLPVEGAAVADCGDVANVVVTSMQTSFVPEQ